VNSKKPAKTLSFATILALTASGGTAIELNRVANPKGLPSAEALSVMGATKGILLTHTDCEAGEVKEHSSKPDGKAKA